jgi:hypothetical protein
LLACVAATKEKTQVTNLRCVDKMNRSSLALLIIVFTACVSLHGQTPARVNHLAGPAPPGDAWRAIIALQRLDRDVLVYRSLGDFEENGTLARVSFDVFRNDLRQVSQEVEPLIARLPQGSLKIEIANALDSYRDGAFWWEKIDQPKVVPVSALTSINVTHTSADAVFLSTVPYTVVIHWRQAGKYLKRAAEMMSASQK